MKVLKLRSVILLSLVFLIGVGFPYSGSIQAAQAEFKLQTASPTVSSVDPATALNDVDTPVTITGTGFVEEEGGVTITAYLGTTELENVAWVSDTELTATVPWGVDPGTYDLIVENPDGQTGTLVDAFTLTTNLSVSAMDPTSGPNDLDTEVTITGTGFIPEREGETVMSPPTVTLESTELVDVIWVSTTELTGTVPWGMDPGTYTLTVENPGGEADTLTDAFTVEKGIGVWNPGKLYGGDIGQVVINPNEPNTVYARGVVGLFRSRDGGGNWSQKFYSFSADFAIDPLSPDRLYLIGTGVGAQRSDDAGENWVTIAPEFPKPSTSARDCNEKGIYVHPTDPGTVFASACSPAGMENGLVKSTNYGEDWNPVMVELTDPQVTVLAFHPDDPTIMYAGTASGNIFQSLNGGDTWSYVSQPLESINQIIINPHDDHKVWISSLTKLGDPCQLLKSDGLDLTNWTPVKVEGESVCPWNIDFAPLDWGAAYSETVFVSSAIGHKGHMTTDGGTSWTELTTESVRDIAPHPTDPNTLYIGSWWDGVKKTVDGGKTWQTINEGMTAVRPYQLKIPSGQLDVVYTMQWEDAPVIYKAVRGGESWQTYSAPTAYSFEIDPFNPSRIYLGGGGQGISISLDGGKTWPTTGEIIPPPQYEDCNHGIITLRASPKESGLLLASVSHFCNDIPRSKSRASIYRSINYGESWTRISLPQEIYRINEIVFHPSDPEVVYFSSGVFNYRESGMYKSLDTGATWQRVGEEYEALNYELELAIEPNTPHRIYAFSSKDWQIWVSEDGGTNWSATADLSGITPTEMNFVPGNPAALYVSGRGPDGGLFRSIDGAKTFQRASGVLGQVQVFSMDSAADDNRVTIYAGTAGGHVENSKVQGINQQDQSTSISAGVYRWTSIVPTFSDVPVDHWAYDWIEDLYNAGLTSGYPDGTYRPGSPVTRAEMAVFLLKGMNTGTYSPPSPDGSHPFGDIAGHWAEDWMEELYDVGLTSGYPDGTYRPQNEVTRAEMAVFLLRAKHGPGYSPPVTSGGAFSDIAGHWAEDWIEQLAAEGITSGYVDGTFRPDNPVTRAEMAVFLVRSFDLLAP